MTVSELIDLLRTFEQTKPVCVWSMLDYRDLEKDDVVEDTNRVVIE